ncbi:MAG: hypothetical protein K2K28_04220, partial [Clostridia bacterium]|nr:hypothetical protein [Clostridia bacterium]
KVFIQKDKLTDDALKYSVQFMTVVSSFLPVVCVKIVSDGAVRGCGGNLGFTVSTFCDLILRVILVYVLTGAGWGFKGVSWAWAIGWSISMFIAIGFWFFTVKRFPKLSASVNGESVPDGTQTEEQPPRSVKEDEQSGLSQNDTQVI